MAFEAFYLSMLTVCLLTEIKLVHTKNYVMASANFGQSLRLARFMHSFSCGRQIFSHLVATYHCNMGAKLGIRH